MDQPELTKAVASHIADSSVCVWFIWRGRDTTVSNGVGQRLRGHGSGRQPCALSQGIALQDHGAKHFEGIDNGRRARQRFN